jgi:hypothetical protein
MFLGQALAPATPPILLSFVSFISALLLVGLCKVWFDEGRFRLFCWQLQRKGFIYEPYVESRIHLETREEAHRIFDYVTKKFNLVRQENREYADTYFDPKVLQSIGGRTAKVRIRTRKGEESHQLFSTGQIVFTKAKELLSRGYEQYRYFPIYKHKFAYIAEDVNHIHKALLPYADTVHPRMRYFTRQYAHNPE